MTDKQKLKKAIKVLKTLKQDAKMALSGAWDKSDDGFEAQIISIDNFLNSLDPPPKSKFKQGELPL